MTARCVLSISHTQRQRQTSWGDGCQVITQPPRVVTHLRTHRHAHTRAQTCTHVHTHLCSQLEEPREGWLALPQAPGWCSELVPHRAAQARTQSASRQERLRHPPRRRGWGAHARLPTLTAILRMDALTEVHLSCLRSMTRMNPMPASCRLRGGESRAQCAAGGWACPAVHLREELGANRLLLWPSACSTHCRGRHCQDSIKPPAGLP